MKYNVRMTLTPLKVGVPYNIG